MILYLEGQEFFSVTDFQHFSSVVVHHFFIQRILTHRVCPKNLQLRLYHRVWSVQHASTVLCLSCVTRRGLVVEKGLAIKSSRILVSPAAFLNTAKPLKARLSLS